MPLDPPRMGRRKQKKKQQQIHKSVNIIPLLITNTVYFLGFYAKKKLVR